jgi:hypothetical protein
MPALNSSFVALSKGAEKLWWYLPVLKTRNANSENADVTVV